MTQLSFGTNWRTRKILSLPGPTFSLQVKSFFRPTMSEHLIAMSLTHDKGRNQGRTLLCLPHHYSLRPAHHFFLFIPPTTNILGLPSLLCRLVPLGISAMNRLPHLLYHLIPPFPQITTNLMMRISWIPLYPIQSKRPSPRLKVMSVAPPHGSWLRVSSIRPRNPLISNSSPTWPTFDAKSTAPAAPAQHHKVAFYWEPLYPLHQLLFPRRPPSHHRLRRSSFLRRRFLRTIFPKSSCERLSLRCLLDRRLC